MIEYTVYFLGVASHSREDVYASNYKEAEALIASKYGGAFAIQARAVVGGQHDTRKATIDK